MTTSEQILSTLKNIETLLTHLALPMQPPVEGSSTWLLSLSEEEERAYARKKGVERRRAGRVMSAHERKTTPKAKDRR